MSKQQHYLLLACLAVSCTITVAMVGPTMLHFFHIVNRK